jgi:hypothetical protein
MVGRSSLKGVDALADAEKDHDSATRWFNHVT